LIIRWGTSGREVGGGDGPDHGTSGNPRNSLESEGSRLPFRRSGVHGRNGPQWRTRPWVSRRKLSRVLDLWHRYFCFSGLKEKAVVLGRGRYGESEERKRSGGATSGHASVRGGVKARTPFLRVRIQDYYAGWLAWVDSLGNGYQLCRSGTRGGMMVMALK
jgi:hypothetical protein